MSRSQAYAILTVLTGLVMTAVFCWENSYSLNPPGHSGTWFQFYFLPEMVFMYLMGRYIPMRIPEDPERVKSILHTSAMYLCGLLLAIMVVSRAISTLLLLAMLMLPFYAGYRLETKP